ncbi:MAG: hypothetical protein ACRDGA_09225, partial [Bacteroidota bacterium]
MALTQPASSTKLGALPGAALRMGFGARGIGLANSMSAVNVGEMSGYYNPALVPFYTSRVGTASYGVLSLDRRLNFLAYGQDLKPTAGISVGIINAGVGNIDGRDVDGRPTRTYSTSENSAILSFGVRTSDDFSFGLSSKILYYHLFEGLNSTTVGFDLGVLYSVTEQWTVSAVLQD